MLKATIWVARSLSATDWSLFLGLSEAKKYTFVSCFIFEKKIQCGFTLILRFKIKELYT
jgi:hypothetical protein